VPLPLERYALIGDTQTAGLVGDDGSLDWLCLPRFDSGACFAALLGDERHGFWRLAPAGEVRRVTRRYRPGTLVLETEFETPEGTVRVVDCMPPRGREPDLARLVQGVEGRVAMRAELAIRFDYGHIVPWVRQRAGWLHAVGGPDALWLSGDVMLHGEDLRSVAEFSVAAGQEAGFVLAWTASHAEPPDPMDARRLVDDATGWWTAWSERCTYDGRFAGDVLGSLVALKALTFAPSGGIVAAPTTSLPEELGGVRNWDYRFCWIRDAAYTLMALLQGGYTQEAEAWRDWLLRAVAGQPEAMRIMYGCAGERRLPELTLDWLPGYEGSAPVRIGNGAATQVQIDVYGELMDASHEGRAAGLAPDAWAWGLQRELMDFLEGAWREPDEGIWEVCGGRQHFVHSKVMAWVAFDRAVRAVEQFGLDGPVERWRARREDIHREVLREGFDAERGTFTRAYGSRELDAALLLIGLVGFLPPTDERVRGTVAAVQRELSEDGLLLRYRTGDGADGLPGREGAFLPCSFWLVDNLALTGRTEEAHALFDRLRGLRNDVGLLSEEYDTRAAAGGQLPPGLVARRPDQQRSHPLRRRRPAPAQDPTRPRGRMIREGLPRGDSG
jgi:GH15 family glucan-1,4-alpha-glucosidase